MVRNRPSERMERPYYVIDAFASPGAAGFTGNPAAVVMEAGGLTDEQMQAIAGEFNLSETTFVLPPSKPGSSNTASAGETQVTKGGDSARRFDNSHSTATLHRPDNSRCVDESPTADALHTADVRFRWFTPTIEVNMCGHATIAGAHALMESGRLQPRGAGKNATVRIETKSGLLTAFVEPIPGGEERMIWLDLIDPTLTPQTLDEPELAAALGLGVDTFESSLPAVRTQDADVLLFVKDFQILNESRPDFTRLARLLDRDGVRGLCLATVKTLTPSITVQSRFFAPAAGIDEDPVTGSVHGPLAAYVVKHGLVPLHDGLAGLMCTQAKPGGRGGLVNALVQPQDNDVYAVRIGGRAVTTMRGTLILGS